MYHYLWIKKDRITHIPSNKFSETSFSDKKVTTLRVNDHGIVFITISTSCQNNE